MVILDGKQAAEQIKQEIKAEVAHLVANGGKKPHLAAVIVGDNGASITYVNAKVKDCEEVGFSSSLIKLSDTTTEKELLVLIDKLNRDKDIDGFIVQLPLPKHIDEKKITMAIKPAKDVDGFHPENIGKMALNLPSFLPATPYGIIELIERYGIETAGKSCVVVGRSHIVGSPISILLSRNSYPGNCTVTLAHSRTPNLKALCLSADIIVAATGMPEFLTGDMVKDGVVVIDVGITRITDKTKKNGFRLIGDVNYAEVAPKASFITPVPGGVGPMTRVALLKNTLLASKLRR
ncbi:MAG TPA: tetrahydrofolate dehydrogenase/cyclohydrolase catalytic domain-containing protein [Luteibaculaceae bacterium]|nr:tetrahydrofolate dehydrogenase/cyclohydrolase catalytic domain-containing protein [Luteibaculaceae bacterium]